MAIGRHATAWLATGLWQPFPPPQKILFRGESTLHVAMNGFQPNIFYVAARNPHLLSRYFSGHLNTTCSSLNTAETRAAAGRCVCGGSGEKMVYARCKEARPPAPPLVLGVPGWVLAVVRMGCFGAPAKAFACRWRWRRRPRALFSSLGASS